MSLSISARVADSRVNAFMEERFSRANSWMTNGSLPIEKLDIDVIQGCAITYYHRARVEIRKGN